MRAMNFAMAVGLFLALLFPIVLEASVSMMGLHTYQNQILNYQGNPVQLHGVSRGNYDTCVSSGTFISGFVGPTFSIPSMQSWKINVVKIPINLNCWLTISGRTVTYGGTLYRNALTNYVRLLADNNFAVILTLATAAPGSSNSATASGPMPDVDYAPTFWANITQVFNTANNFTNVMYELYHQPYPAGGADSTSAWQCWLNGATSCSETYSVVGMASLISTIRYYSPNIIIVPGISHGNSLSSFLSYAGSLYTNKNNLVAGVSVSDQVIHRWCSDASCWMSQYGAVNTANWPIIVTSASESDCQASYVTDLVYWTGIYSAGQVGFIIDAWVVRNCTSGGLLCDSYGNPSDSYGSGVRSLLQLNY